jgi:hypothetical protein
VNEDSVVQINVLSYYWVQVWGDQNLIHVYPNLVDPKFRSPGVGHHIHGAYVKSDMMLQNKYNCISVVGFWKTFDTKGLYIWAFLTNVVWYLWYIIAYCVHVLNEFKDIPDNLSMIWGDQFNLDMKKKKDILYLLFIYQLNWLNISSVH